MSGEEPGREGGGREERGRAGHGQEGRGQEGRGRDGSVANIGTVQRRRRLIVGLVASTVAAIGLVALLAVDANRLWRLALFIPLWAGATGFFQHRKKT